MKYCVCVEMTERMLYLFLPNKLFWSFLLYYNKTKVVVIGVPIGVSKLRKEKYVISLWLRRNVAQGYCIIINFQGHGSLVIHTNSREAEKNAGLETGKVEKRQGCGSVQANAHGCCESWENNPLQLGILTVDKHSPIS